VPAGLIDQEHGVCAGRDGLGNLGEMQVHRLGIAGEQDQGRALTLFRADGTEDIGRGGALITGSARAGEVDGPCRPGPGSSIGRLAPNHQCTCLARARPTGRRHLGRLLAARKPAFMEVSSLQTWMPATSAGMTIPLRPISL
jgi:hypothetical protein